jgi:hypothetical protein
MEEFQSNIKKLSHLFIKQIKNPGLKILNEQDKVINE